MAAGCRRPLGSQEGSMSETVGKKHHGSAAQPVAASTPGAAAAGGSITTSSQRRTVPSCFPQFSSVEPAVVSQVNACRLQCRSTL